MAEKSTFWRSHWREAAFLCVFLLGIVIDRITKIWALKNLTAQSDVPLLGGFIRLTLLHNSGATMSFAASNTIYLSVFAIIATVVSVWVGQRTQSTWWSITLALTASGAFGNLFDRMLYQTSFLNGAVVDFINYGPFVGNVADIILTVSAVMIVLGILRSERFGMKHLDGLLYGDDKVHKDDENEAGDTSR